MLLASPDEARRQRILLKRQQAKEEFSNQENKEGCTPGHDSINGNTEEKKVKDAVRSGDEIESLNIKKPRLDIPDPKSIITNVYRYLDQEYKFMKIRSANDSNLHLLSAIRERTAAATGVSVTQVRKIVKEDRMRMAENKHRVQEQRRSHQGCGMVETESQCTKDN